MKNRLLYGAFIAALFLPTSALAQGACDAKKMSFTEFTACAEAALVKDTQGICFSGSKCFDGAADNSAADNFASQDDIKTGSPVASEVAVGSAPVLNVPSEINRPVDRVVESIPKIEATTQTRHAEVKAPGGYEARVLFALGSAELLSLSSAELDEIATVMLSKPHLGLQIEGHASADGDESYNLDLSSKRAEAVRNALLIRGVPIERLTHKGYGELRLKDASNPNSPENRRVEMVLGFSIN